MDRLFPFFKTQDHCRSTSARYVKIAVCLKSRKKSFERSEYWFKKKTYTFDFYQIFTV